MSWEGLARNSKPPLFEELIGEFEKAWEPVPRRVTEKTGDEVVRLTKMNTPIDEHGPHPGNLRESVHKSQLLIYNEQLVVVHQTGAETDVDYAPYVEEGTGLWGPEHKKYLIKPKSDYGVLSWVDWRTGHRVFAKWVWHPGSPGQHMFAIGVAAAEPEFEKLADEGLVEFRRRCEAVQLVGHYGASSIKKAA